MGGRNQAEMTLSAFYRKIWLLMSGDNTFVNLFPLSPETWCSFCTLTASKSSMRPWPCPRVNASDNNMNIPCSRLPLSTLAPDILEQSIFQCCEASCLRRSCLATLCHQRQQRNALRVDASQHHMEAGTKQNKQCSSVIHTSKVQTLARFQTLSLSDFR